VLEEPDCEPLVEPFAEALVLLERDAVQDGLAEDDALLGAADDVEDELVAEELGAEELGADELCAEDEGADDAGEDALLDDDACDPLGAVELLEDPCGVELPADEDDEPEPECDFEPLGEFVEEPAPAGSGGSAGMVAGVPAA
jgi:hypothetical protein